MIRVFLNNQEISNQTEIDLSFVEKLDRELDEGFIVIAHTNTAEQYPMFSIIDIFEDANLIFSGRISSDDVELSSFGDEYYNHNLTLIEHTKILEKYYIQGKSFTQPVSDPNTPFYTMYDVVDILRKTVLFEREGQEEGIAPFTIPAETQTILENIIAPELNFKDVTLRQALDEVGNYFNAISRLKRNNELVYDNFNELKEEIQVVTENYRKKQNINGYSTIMTSDVINPVNQIKEDSTYNFEYYPSKDLWTTLRSDFGLFNFEDSVIPTPKNIYEILEVWTPVKINIQRVIVSSGDKSTYLDEDFYPIELTSQVVEKNEYDTLELPVAAIPSIKSKINTIFYTYGKKGIKVGETYGIFDIRTAYKQAVDAALLNYMEKTLPNDSTWFNTGQYDGDLNFITDDGTFVYEVNYEILGEQTALISSRRWQGLFRVKYIPLPSSIRYEVVRDDIEEVDFFSFGSINQKLRLVDLEIFANNMKGRINQLGEGQLILSHKVKNISDSWNVGDFTINNEIITKKEVIAQLDHYIINYELNRNFNKISQFVGVDQEIRQYEIAESGRTIDRDLNYNEYIEVYADDTGSFQKDNNTTTIVDTDNFLSTFDGSFTKKTLSFATFSSPEVVDEDGNFITTLLPFYKISGGGAFGFHMDFETNASAGNQLVEGDETFFISTVDEFLEDISPYVPLFDFSLDRQYNAPFKYTDRIGRFDTMSIDIYNHDLSEQFESFDDEISVGKSIPEFRKQVTESPAIQSNFFVKKDNRERLKITMLYHLLSKNVNEVIIGKKLYTHNGLLYEKSNDLDIRFFKKDPQQPNKPVFTTRDFEKQLTNEELKLSSSFLSISYVNSFIEITADTTQYDGWAITDQDGYPFIMVNGTKKRVVFEFNNKRGGLRYLGDISFEKLKSPEFVSSTSTSDSLTIELKNINNTEVSIQAQVGNVVQMQDVLPDDTHTFTFSNLEPNFTHSVSGQSNPIDQPTLFPSSIKFFPVTTDKFPIDPPSFTSKRFETFDTGDGLGYLLFFDVTNPNDVACEVYASVNGFEYEASQAPIPANTTVEIGLPYVGDGEFFDKNTNYSLQMRSRTGNFTNNWYSDFTPLTFISVGKLDPPNYGTASVTQTGITVFWGNPNAANTLLEVEMYNSLAEYQEPRFFVESKTVSISSLSSASVNFSGLLSNQPYSFKARLLDTGFNEGSEFASSPSIFTQKFTTVTPSINIVKGYVNALDIDLTNNDDNDTNIYYSVDNTTPTTGDRFVTASPSQTVRASRAFGSLVENTLYTVYARAMSDNENFSGTVSDVFATGFFKPEISNVQYATSGSDIINLTFDVFNDNGGTEDIICSLSLEDPVDRTDVANGGTISTDLAKNSTTSFSINYAPGDFPLPPQDFILVIGFNNNYSSEADEIRVQT